MTLTRPTNQKTVAEMVAGLLKCAKETSERARAASAMASLARDQMFNRVSLAAAGAIPQLIRILSEAPETTLRQAPPAEAASAMASASPPARNIRSMAMAARAVTAINKSHAQVQATYELHSCVAEALRYLAMVHPPNQMAIARDGAVPCRQSEARGRARRDPATRGPAHTAIFRLHHHHLLLLLLLHGRCFRRRLHPPQLLSQLCA